MPLERGERAHAGDGRPAAPARSAQPIAQASGQRTRPQMIESHGFRARLQPACERVNRVVLIAATGDEVEIVGAGPPGTEKLQLRQSRQSSSRHTQGSDADQPVNLGSYR